MSAKRKQNEGIDRGCPSAYDIWGVEPPVMGAFFPDEFYDGKP